MRDPGDHTAQQPTETLQAGPDRPPLFEIPWTQWRQPVVTFLTFVVGVTAGGAAVLAWQASTPPRPAPAPAHVDEHAVELVLLGVVPSGTHPSGWESGSRPLHVDSAVFLTGAVTSTVLGVDSLNRSLAVRAHALPVTVSPAARFQSVGLTIVVRDCKAATRWTPVDRPFTITWVDEDGRRHLDRAGDFDRHVARTLIHYIDAVCGIATRED